MLISIFSEYCEHRLYITSTHAPCQGRGRGQRPGATAAPRRCPCPGWWAGTCAGAGAGAASSTQTSWRRESPSPTSPSAAARENCGIILILPPYHHPIPFNLCRCRPGNPSPSPPDPPSTPCPKEPGWFRAGASCYLVSLQPMSWHGAQEVGRKHNIAQLATMSRGRYQARSHLKQSFW